MTPPNLFRASNQQPTVMLYANAGFRLVLKRSVGQECSIQVMLDAMLSIIGFRARIDAHPYYGCKLCEGCVCGNVKRVSSKFAQCFLINKYRASAL